MDKTKIHDFSKRWISKFQAQQIYAVEELMGNECETLGFVMDCEKSFFEKYPDAFPDNLAQFINDINDLQLLGNALYSQWRYYQHWTCAPWNVQWFLTVLNRMAELSSE